MRFKSILGASATALAVLVIIMAYTTTADAARNDVTSTAGKFRFDFGIGIGRGTDSYVIGHLEGTNEPVRISPGGGGGFTATLGYGLTKRFDIDVTVEKRKSVTQTPVTSGGAHFKRKAVLGTFKVKFPYKTGSGFYNGQIKVGAGGGLYFDPVLTIEFSDNASGTGESYIYDFDPAIGYHVSVDFETFLPNNWSLTIGFRYYKVSYEINSLTYTSTTPMGTSTASGSASGLTLDGSGVDLLITVGKYFF